MIRAGSEKDRRDYRSEWTNREVYAGEPQDCVITVKEVGRLGKQKRRRLDQRRNKGRNLKQSAVVQGRRAPRRLLI